MYQEQMLGMQFRRSAATLRSIWSAGNEYVDAAAPWTVFKADRDRAAAIVRVAINLIRLFAALSAPMIPAVAGRMLQALQLPVEPRWLSGKLAADLQAMKPGHSFQVPEVLFGKIEDAQVEDWKSQFGGMEVNEAEELRLLREENQRLKKLVADLSLDKDMLKSVISKNGYSSRV